MAGKRNQYYVVNAVLLVVFEIRMAYQHHHAVKSIVEQLLGRTNAAVHQKRSNHTEQQNRKRRQLIAAVEPPMNEIGDSYQQQGKHYRKAEQNRGEQKTRPVRYKLEHGAAHRAGHKLCTGNLPKARPVMFRRRVIG
jgi:hypothetical protein